MKQTYFFFVSDVISAVFGNSGSCYLQGCSGVGTDFPHLFALVTLLEDVGSKQLH